MLFAFDDLEDCFNQRVLVYFIDPLVIEKELGY